MLVCSTCQQEKLESEFNKNRTRLSGFNAECRECTKKRSAAQREEARAKNAEIDRERRLASDYDSLGKENYAALHGGTTDKVAKGLKRQEFTVEMGEVKDLAREAVLGNEERLARYTTGLAEDERRFENRRTARTLNLSIARDELQLRRFKEFAKEFLADKIEPKGYARTRDDRPKKRAVISVLSDLHIGAALGSDNPTRFEGEQESRRLAQVAAETCDFKIDHRANSDLIVLWNGDLFEGLLLHDLRDGAPLTEQFGAFWQYAGRMVGMFAAAFPTVRCYFSPGNHGRNKLRHPGRATSSKWDSLETTAMLGLAAMCSQLKNVTFQGAGFEHRLPVNSIPLPGGHWLFQAHGDTEPKISDPDTKAVANFGELSKVNATKRYGQHFDVFAFGHFHKARLQPVDGFSCIFNGALVPPNGHARAMGYASERCGQWVFEAVEGYPLGDPRFIEVNTRTDADSKLSEIIPPFRYGG